MGILPQGLLLLRFDHPSDGPIGVARPLPDLPDRRVGRHPAVDEERGEHSAGPASAGVAVHEDFLPFPSLASEKATKSSIWSNVGDAKSSTQIFLCSNPASSISNVFNRSHSRLTTTPNPIFRRRAKSHPMNAGPGRPARRPPSIV